MPRKKFQLSLPADDGRVRIPERTGAWVPWEKDTRYPTKRGICEFCGQRDDLKMSFDQYRYICVNASACFLRWKKSRMEK